MEPHNRSATQDRSDVSVSLGPVVGIHRLAAGRSPTSSVHVTSKFEHSLD